MKKLMFIGILTFGIIHFSAAQFKPNDVAFGLLFNPYHNEADYLTLTEYPFIWYDKQGGFEITPSAGLFVSDHTELGIGAGFTWNKQHTLFDSSNERDSYGRSLNFSIYEKNYFPLNEKLSITLTETVSYNLGKTHIRFHYFNPESVSESDQKTVGYSLGLIPGLSYFPVKKCQLTASIGNLGFSKIITRDNAGNQIINKQKIYGLTINLDTIVFGIQYIL